MSRNAPQSAKLTAGAGVLGGIIACLLLNPDGLHAGPSPETTPRARVIAVHDGAACDAFKPVPARVKALVDSGIRRFTGRTNTASAWAGLVTTNDIVGIKVYSVPGPDAGTRPAVVEAVVEGLLGAGVPPRNIVIWDRQRAELRKAGFMEVAEKHGVRVEGSVNAGFDEGTSYSPERPVPGQLVFGDVEFGRKGDGVARRSFVTRLLTKDVTKIISINPLLNHNTTGVTGHLYSLAQGSVDNFIRFENDLLRLSTAVPEIFALPAIADKVVLNITDGLICQYHGESQGLLHYAVMLNELRFSKDPVALDLLSLRELERVRQAAKTQMPRETSFTNQVELLQNAALLELGVAEFQQITVERFSNE